MMSFLEIIQSVNQNGFIIALVMLILSCIKLPKYELNIWQLFLKSVNKETNDKLDNLDKKFFSLQKSFDRHIEEDLKDEMDQKRRNILNFNSEVKRKIGHTEEQYNQIIEDIDAYENFCVTHPNYKNTKAEVSIKNIKEAYSKGDFL